MKNKTGPLTILLVSVMFLTACGAMPLANKLPGVLKAAPQAVLPAAGATPAAAQSNTAPQTSNLPAVSGEGLAALQGTLENIYSQVNPSVVNIQVTSPAPAASQLPFGFSLPGQQDNPGGNAPSQSPAQQALGSGFVWDNQGHIVTNNHVVDGASQVTVTFADGRVLPAKVVGHDPDSDLAVIQVQVSGAALTPLQMANSDQVRVGQLAIAIGNPFGLEGSMTVGIVSGLGRSLSVDNTTTQGGTYTIPDIIQTDASINPGNSGGVLVDDRGAVIGVTSAIESPVRASSGVGFVIPAEIVKRVVPQLIEKGTFVHPWLGLSGASLTPPIAKEMGLAEDQKGILVEDVTSGSPADKAGLHGSDRQATLNGGTIRVGGDVLLSISGVPLGRFDDLASYLVRKGQVGDTVPLEVLRDGKSIKLDLTLAARPSQSAQANSANQNNNNNTPRGASTRGWLGIQGATLTAEINQAMNVAQDTQGVLVVQVVPGAPADKAGLKGGTTSTQIQGKDILLGGDIITAANGQPVTTMNELQSAIAKLKAGAKVEFNILRDGSPSTLTVTLGERPQS